MKKQYLIWLILFYTLLLFYSCKKEKQFSIWIINNRDTFMTNNVVAEGGCSASGVYCVAALKADSYTNRFDLSFDLAELPAFGTWQINNGTGSNDKYAYLSFYFNSQFYILSPNETSFLQIDIINNKVGYILNPSWYVNYYNHNDSIQIQGVFKEP